MFKKLIKARQKGKMVYCFAPTCGHSSEGNTCKFFAFPSAIKQHNEYRRWIRLIRYELIFIKNANIVENLMDYKILSEILIRT